MKNKQIDKPMFNKMLCSGCALCVEACPKSCLKISEPRFHGDINTIVEYSDKDACIGCKLCQKACPLGAILFKGDESSKSGLTPSKVFCRSYQGVFKVGMNFLPWGMPKTLSGPGCLKRLPALIKSRGFNRVLIVTDKVLNKDLKMLDELYEEMKNEGVEYVVYDGVQPNPTDINAKEGLNLFKKYHCQAIVAFGGGSPMDCAKAIGAMYARPGKSINQLQGLFRVLRRIPTIFAVPTTAGTGSETTVAAVITDSKTKHKASMNDTCLMPKYAILDPLLTTGLPPKVTSTTGLDALCHAVESYTNHTYNTKFEDKLALKAVRLIYKNLYKCYENGDDVEARLKMQKAALYAGRAFTRGCVGYVHALGHTLGGLYGTPHGLAMSVILPHVMRQFGPAAHSRLARLAEACGMKGETDAIKAEKFISWIEEMKEKMDIPVGLDVIKDEDIPQIVTWAMKEANPLYPVPVIWGREDFEKLITTVSQS